MKLIPLSENKSVEKPSQRLLNAAKAHFKECLPNGASHESIDKQSDELICR